MTRFTFLLGLVSSTLFTISIVTFATPASSGTYSAAAKHWATDNGNRNPYTIVELNKDLVGNTLGDTESFQWVNLIHSNTMLIALTDHRYLATKPNSSGPVKVSATGPHPDRNVSACFKWKAVE